MGGFVTGRASCTVNALAGPLPDQVHAIVAKRRKQKRREEECFITVFNLKLDSYQIKSFIIESKG